MTPFHMVEAGASILFAMSVIAAWELARVRVRPDLRWPLSEYER